MSEVRSTEQQDPLVHALRLSPRGSLEQTAADEIERLHTIIRSIGRIVEKPCSYKERVTRIVFALGGLKGPQVTS